jgi:hypothetical protein
MVAGCSCPAVRERPVRVGGPGRARAGLQGPGRARADDPPASLLRGLTQSQIAEQIGISQMHVSRLIRRSLEIRETIAEDEESLAR